MAIGDVVTSMRGGRVIPRQSIYEQSATALHNIGDSIEPFGDGRIFYYAKNGAAALGDGLLLQGAIPLPNHLNCTVAAGAAIGDTRVSVTLGATPATINYYANGYMHANDEVPEGTLYKIKSHLSNAGSLAMWVELYDPLVKAMVISSSQVTLTKAKYDSVTVALLSGLTALPIGVSLIDVTIGYYSWVQTWGPCPVLTQGTVVIGAPVGLGGTADGAIGPITASTTAVVGWVMQVNASQEYSLIDLKIAP
jgi:hypothetical protein